MQKSITKIIPLSITLLGKQYKSILQKISM